MSTAWGERLEMLHQSRQQLYSLPCDQLFELPGRPNVLYSLKNYTADKTAGAAECRQDMPFLFKAFETGQIGPRRLSRMVGENKPRNATIHEYLDWTVTGVEAKNEGEYDFSGFRLLILVPRERVMWPAPGQYDTPEPRKHPNLGAPLDPLPKLMVKGKPLSAATIRTGPGYIEVPFVATHESKRGRGFGRCVVEAIEDVARALNIQRLLLCSTRETSVHSTWKHLGFFETSEQQLAEWNVEDADLVHMQNTLQMHKEVPAARMWRPVVIRHQAFVARVYVAADKQSLSSKSCVQRPGMHEMGANSGYRSSRATSNLTTGSASNASFGTAGEQDQQQQQDEAGSALAVPDRSSQPPLNGAANGAAAGAVANGIRLEQQQQQQPQPMAVDQQQQQGQQPGQQQQQGPPGLVKQETNHHQQQQQGQQQQQSEGDLLLPAAAVTQQEQPFICSGVGGAAAAGGAATTPFAAGAAVAAQAMDTS